MRFLHIADLHIGKRVCEFSMLEEQRHVLEQVLCLLVEREVDALLVAGDLYDKSLPSAEAVAMVDWFLSEVAARGVPAIVIPGNHDSAERVAYAGTLLARQGVHVAPVYAGAIEPVELEDALGPVHVWPVPFVRPAQVRHFAPEEQIETYTDAMRVVLEGCRLNKAERNVIVAHQFVTSAGTEVACGGSEVSIGGLDNVDASVFAGASYVALGHIHRAQRVGSERVRYAGSILKYSLSEADGAKYALLVDVGEAGEEPVVEPVPLVPIHDLRRIKGPLASLVSGEVVAAGDAEDYLHVILTDEHPAIDAMATLREVYPNVMSVEYDNARTRAEGLAHEAELPQSEDDASALELFAEFYELQNGSELTETQRALVMEELEKLEVR